MARVKKQTLKHRIGKRTDTRSEPHKRKVKRTKGRIAASRFKRIRRKILGRKGPQSKGSIGRKKRGPKVFRKRPRTLRRKKRWKGKRGNINKVDLFKSNKSYKQHVFVQVISEPDSQLDQYDQGFYRLGSHQTFSPGHLVQGGQIFSNWWQEEMKWPF